MYKIAAKRALNETVTLMEVEAPFVAQKAAPGQFIILRIDAYGERIPLTVAGADAQKGTVTIIFQQVGRSTVLLASLEVGECLLDFVGPLGIPTHFGSPKRACVVGGGVGCAIAYPQAKALHEAGVAVDIIAGFRSKDIVILEEEMEAVCQNLYITTDDGSYREKGFVTDKLKTLLQAGNGYDLVIAIGPVIMMKFICDITKTAGIRTLVSLNPIMIDGTGMCGCCRVSVGGQTRFACVDGPDFDGHLVDFEELMGRNAIYKEIETADAHRCRLLGGAVDG